MNDRCLNIMVGVFYSLLVGTVLYGIVFGGIEEAAREKECEQLSAIYVPKISACVSKKYMPKIWERD